MVHPVTMRREDEQPLLAQDMMNCAKIGAWMQDMLQHLRGKHNVRRIVQQMNALLRVQIDIGVGIARQIDPNVTIHIRFEKSTIGFLATAHIDQNRVMFGAKRFKLGNFFQRLPELDKVIIAVIEPRRIKPIGARPHQII